MDQDVTSSVGICLGASNISLVEVKRRGTSTTIVNKRSRPHLGNVRNCLIELLEKQRPTPRKRICVTGRKLRYFLNLTTIAEPEAVELATKYILPEDHPYRVVASAGGETFLVYHLDERGGIQNIHTGNKCASGTGEFFLQQLRRMDISLDEVAAMEIPETPLKVSSRCSVFCKSDCTHALNKGEDKSSVIAGLSNMMSDKLIELFQTISMDHVLLVGGCAGNKAMVHFLTQKVRDLHIPDESHCFEALGAALWALDNQTLPLPELKDLFNGNGCRFSFHPPLANYLDMVQYEHRTHGTAEKSDRVILGLDVGSTTTKGILVRRTDKKVLASTYLRTNGDPIEASRKVYRSILEQLHVDVIIEGVGVTGSGRQIAGLHAQTQGVVNEIIAHATAAAFFDPDVDTIFEIGGQDAKYTYLVNGVPSDYAMNEACSAGTGSFLEESARESLGLDVTVIGDMALQGKEPPDFNDQCAAFISSDVKSAVQQRIATEDIVAGLVYSVAMNFINRVKGNRPVGKKIFIQGGVCYNKAVPTAIAALTGNEVIVPPDPGLMGAFGVALEIEKRMEQGLLPTQNFILKDIAERNVTYGKPFVCHGGKNKCDRKCKIATIIIDEKRYPFGGICNRYDTIQGEKKRKISGLDLVSRRQLLNSACGAGKQLNTAESAIDDKPAVRMNRSFFLHSYFPFFSVFFQELGFRLVVPETLLETGESLCSTPFCYPVKLSHGYAASMMTVEADYTVLPHIKGLPAGDHDTSCTCVFTQSEPFYLKSVFPELDNSRTLSPTIDFSDSREDQVNVFNNLAKTIGIDSKTARRAFEKAEKAQDTFSRKLKEAGRRFIAELEAHPDAIGIVLFGRPYNSFAEEANKGINLKFASKGVKIVPFDMLSLEDFRLEENSNMFWAMGRFILQCAQFVSNHPQLFALYITNFSCGPDSFILTYFRDIMGIKPSLILELDSHTADAGIETRIEAFLDIIASYKSLRHFDSSRAVRAPYKPAEIIDDQKRLMVRISSGKKVPFTDPRVKMLIPAMGRYTSPLLAKALTKSGIRTSAMPAADSETLRIGRANSSCKECLPLQTTIGSLLHYLNNGRPRDEVTVYMMPSAPGPCRFGQYNVYAKRLISKFEIDNVAVFSPSSKNCYGGLGLNVSLSAWYSIIIGDLFNEIWSTILAGAVDKTESLALFNQCYDSVLEVINRDWRTISSRLKQCAHELSKIELVRSYGEIPKISLVGEIYVRHDPVSLQKLVERMAAKGFIVRTAENSEWIKYLDWLISNDILGNKSVGFRVFKWAKKRAYSTIRTLLAPSGLFYQGDMDVKHVVNTGAQYLSPQLKGEAILTVGTAFHDILSPSCGVISIGPFGCMPTRVAEAILTRRFNTAEKKKSLNGRAVSSLLMGANRKLPFLAIETDGTPFPQIIEARLEAFCLQAERLHAEMLNVESR